jgi:glycosyltransferase involved in cell wall biosynthesis
VKKRILIIAPYDNIYPPLNGGMQRCFHIINQLALHFDVTAIIHQEKEAFLKAAEVYPSISRTRIHSTAEESYYNDIFNLLPNRLQDSFRYRWIRKNVIKPADGSFLKYYPVLKALLKKNRFDVIVMENLFTTNAVKAIRKYAGNATIIYDAHNVDSILLPMEAGNSRKRPKHLKGIKKAESSLYKKVDAAITCSEKDNLQFLKMNRGKLKTAVVANGVSISDLKDGGVMEDVPRHILFCGALWTTANSEGLYWFHKQIWPEVKKVFPLLKLLIVGSGKLPDQYNTLAEDDSLVFTGAVDDVKPWYNEASVAIVPILSGSGTRLKIPEAMSLGVPVVSTAKGAEGIDYTDGVDIIIADESITFADKVIRLLRNKEQRLFIRDNGRKLVQENYDWNMIGISLANFIKTFPGISL